MVGGAGGLLLVSGDKFLGFVVLTVYTFSHLELDAYDTVLAYFTVRIITRGTLHAVLA